MSTIPLAVSASAVFGPDGTARVALGPTVYGTTWTIERMGSTTTSTVETELRVYKNVESPTTYVDGSSQGNNDVSDGSNLKLLNLDTLLFVWSGGDPAASATITLYGEQEMRRR